MSRSTNIVNLKDLQVTGKKQQPEEGRSKTADQGLNPEESRALSLPDPARLFRRSLAELAGQSALLVYQGKQGDYHLLNASFSRNRPGNPLAVSPQTQISDSLKRTAAEQIGIDPARLSLDTHSSTMFPAVDLNGELRLLPQQGRNVQLLPLNEAVLPDRTYFVQLAQLPSTQVPGSKQTPGPSKPTGPQPLADFGKAVAQQKGKQAVIVFRSVGRNASDPSDDTYYYLQTTVSAEQGAGFPARRVSVAERNQTTAISTTVPDARLTELATQLGLPKGTVLQPLSKAPDGVKQGIAAKPLIANGRMYMTMTESWAELGLSPVGVMPLDAKATAATPGAAPAAKPWTAELLNAKQLQEQLLAHSKEPTDVFLVVERPGGERQVLAATLHKKTGVNFDLYFRKNAEVHPSRPSLGDTDKATVAAALKVTPDQVKPFTDDGLVFRRNSDTLRKVATLNGDRLRLLDEDVKVYAVIPR